MGETHSSIMTRLIPLYEMAPERFMTFYDAVYLMCVDLPEGAGSVFQTAAGKRIWNCSGTS